MFGPRRFFRFLIGSAFLFMLFSLFSRGAFQNGYWRGYMAAQENQPIVQVITTEDGVTRTETITPSGGEQLSPRAERPGMGGGFLAIIGGIFRFFFFLLLFGFFFKLLFGRRHGRHWGGPHGHHWHRHGWNGHKDEQPGPEKSPEDVEPDIRTA